MIAPVFDALIVATEFIIPSFLSEIKYPSAVCFRPEMYPIYSTVTAYTTIAR
ncbi:MAG: hypothetical protein QF755_05470 [Candidatus Peribacteraceae bacterium]|nr:hypothetical protein [Candidatus Peribacteraceae bacterium]